MIKTPPSAARVAAMVVFTLSCVSILLFLWLRFGGAIPLAAKGYEVRVAFPEAVQLTSPVDVRAAGITIGQVRRTELERSTGRTLATIELDSRYAPLRRDARATLRIKTLLGETIVEMTPGSPDAPPLADGARLPDGQVGETVELDEVISTYDPRTRAAFRTWQQELGQALGRRGEQVNHFLGHLPDFVGSSSNLLGVLDRHERELRGLVRDTGHTYAALTQDEAQLRNLITGSRELFRQTAAERESLAEAIRIFPTFLDESRLTAERLESFSARARPLVRELRPGMRELGPTVASLRRLAPRLTSFSRAFGAQIDHSDESLPATREILDETRPMFGALWPMFAELNPIFRWFEMHQLLISDFLANGGSALADTTDARGPGETGHYLRQASVSGAEALALHRTRLSSNRGNSYLPPVITSLRTIEHLIFPNWDCKPSGGEKKPVHGTGGAPGCFEMPKMVFQGREQGFLPHVERDDYSAER